ncbi:Polyprotein of EF-T, chloroplastic [Sesamum angolense]|uniref:Elongation factor Ts, mitochondrial n=1 Tax=Sesamum angolense TaxID=2727404 RepID=A0AAE2BTG9_9LAMI|nr:Polyprotein of EF-T, chloroplastic [Sesamum angolense]
MAPVIPSSTNNVPLSPGIAFITKKSNLLSRCSIPRKLNREALPAQKYILPLSTSIRLFPQFRIGCILKPKLRTHIASASGTEVAVEEADLSPAENEASVNGTDAAETTGDSSAKSDISSIKSKRSRPVRKSEMPPVKDEELIPGATFTGKDVASVVTVGQEVKVRLIEANMETGRIALSMRESDDSSKQQRDAPGSSDKSRPPRKTNQRFNQKREETKKTSKFVKGQDLEGTVKNLTRAGAFISLPEGEEGFLPTSEEADEGFGSMMGSSSLEVGQEVSVRVLRITRGQVTLTMKKEEAIGELDAKLSQGVVHTATNPFVLAFRSNQVISEFLDERENEKEVVGKADEVAKDIDEVVSRSADTLSEALAKEENVETIPQTFETNDDEIGNEGQQQLSGELTDETLPDIVEEVTAEAANDVIAKDEDESEKTDNTKPSVTQDEEASALNPEKNDSSDSSSAEIEAKSTVGISPALVKQLREETGAGMMDCKKALSETGGDIVKAQEYLRKKGLASADKKSSRATAEGRIGAYIHDSRIGVLIEVNCETDFVARGDIFRELVEDLAMQVAACPQVQYLSIEDVPKEIVDKEKEIEMQKEDLLSKPEQIRSKIVDGRIRKRLEELALLEQPFIKDDKIVVKDWVKQTISTIGENIKVKRFVRYNLGDGLEKKNQDFAAEVAAQTAAKPNSASVKQEPAAAETKETVEEAPKAVVSAALVKQLREETGAGMMDCKKALSETGGDLEKAQEYLRKKGLSAADKKSSRLAAEGRIGCYIHDSRIGVLIEVNCETDFVGRSQNFKELVDDLAMQIVACPQVQYVSIDDIPENIRNKEKEMEMQREDIQSKPENIREKIVEGRVTKRLGKLALLEQSFIKNDSMLVKDLVKQTVAGLGENIKVRRFVRFTLGETSDAKPESEA